MLFQKIDFGSYDNLVGFSNDNPRNRPLQVRVSGNHTSGYALLQSFYFNARSDDWQLQTVSFSTAVTNITYTAASNTTIFSVLFTFSIWGSDADLFVDPKEASVKMTALLVIPEAKDDQDWE